RLSARRSSDPETDQGVGMLSSLWDCRTDRSLGLNLVACVVLVALQSCVPVDHSSLRSQLTKHRQPLLPYSIIETTQADIGPAGGTVSLGKANVQIPSPALRRKVAIGIQRLDSKSVPPLP